LEDEPGRDWGPAGNRYGVRALGFEFSVFRLIREVRLLLLRTHDSRSRGLGKPVAWSDLGSALC
jgi:hypothetical protein